MNIELRRITQFEDINLRSVNRQNTNIQKCHFLILTKNQTDNTDIMNIYDRQKFRYKFFTFKENYSLESNKQNYNMNLHQDMDIISSFQIMQTWYLPV